MCGLIALFTESPLPQAPADAALVRLSRRGPDREGRWQEEGVYLGHRRLAILDLDARAAQPMHSGCGRYVIVFNGEIYNYRSLRADLEARGVAFRTTSDTEVILALFSREGEAMLPRLHGMFAFVIWDCLEQKAFAARDPYGIKPLYVAQVKGGVALASQVKALLATGLVDTAPDPVGQAGFWMLGSVPEPHTWYRDIQSLRAGHCLCVEAGEARRQRCWHDIAKAWREAAHASAAALPEAELRARVRAALVESVDRHLVSDVPVGVFLSGGIDSGAVAGLMQERGATSLLGVTIAYDDYAGRNEDEAPAAAQIARHYGIRHHVRRVSQVEFIDDLPRILDAMDQPSIDGINTWYASKAVAEQGLKVVVSGVGGDELFLGYESFWLLPPLATAWRWLSTVPGLTALARLAAGVQARRNGNARWRHAPDWLRQGMAGAW
jgi:asparagine synthase (glutamine-hydrolysing)